MILVSDGTSFFFGPQVDKKYWNQMSTSKKLRLKLIFFSFSTILIFLLVFNLGISEFFYGGGGPEFFMKADNSLSTLWFRH